MTKQTITTTAFQPHTVVLTLLFLIFMGSYLMVEIGYNAWLLDVAGSGTSDPDELKKLEKYGRAMAATGFTLLCLTFGFGSNGYRLNSWRSLLVATGIIILCALPFLWSETWYAGGGDKSEGNAIWIIFPALSLLSLPIAWYARDHKVLGALVLISILPMATFTGMYHGQLIAIERLVVDTSTPEDRWRAQLLSLLKQGYTHGIVSLGDIERNGDLLPEEKTLLAFSGMLFGDNEALIEEAKEKKPLIIGQLIELQFSDSVDIEYRQYQQSAKKLIEQTWTPYTALVRQYDQAIADTDSQAARQWNALLDSLDIRWKSYQEKQNAYQQRIRELIPTVNKHIAYLDGKMHECNQKYSNISRVTACEERYINDYNRQVVRMLGKEVPWQSWCVQQSFGATIKQGRLPRLNNFLFDQGKTLRCPGGDDTVYQQLDRNYRPAFIDQSGGYPPDLASIAQFRAMKATQDQIRNSLAKKGIKLPSNWTLADRDTFVHIASRQFRQETDKQWQRWTQQHLGISLPVIRDYARFEKHAVIQEKIRTAFGITGDDSLSLTLGRDEYRQQILVPVIEQKIEDHIQALRYPERFADGEPQEEEGRNAIRGIRIPAISLTLSLIFALLGCANLLAMSVRLLSTSLLRKMPELFHKGVYLGIWCISIGLVILAPYSMETRLSNSALYQYYQADLREHAPIGSYAMDWLLRAQPWIYPIGEKIRHRS